MNLNEEKKKKQEPNDNKTSLLYDVARKGQWNVNLMKKRNASCV